VGCECGGCAPCDEELADEHGERCVCESCERVRAREARRAREREAAACGGLVGWGREALGW
jgi:hypothetical protein